MHHFETSLCGRAAALAALLTMAAAGPGVLAAPVGSLAGKTCQGTFDTGRKQEVSKGALQLQFADEAGRLAAHLWRRVGRDARDQAAYALTQRRPIETTGFEDLGAVRDLAVAGKTIRFSDAAGVKYSLSYRADRLDGQSDPRGGSDPRMTRVAFVRMLCR